MPHKILVIEDSEELLGDIIEMLSLEGFKIFSATNGEVGVEIAMDEIPDLIVCDIRMPIMDGYSVLQHIRNQAVTMNIPFIFLTARTGRSEMREGMRLGADDYLTKPFTAHELITSIKSRLQRREIAREETHRKLDELRRSIALALPHELRTPLNAILGFSEILMTDIETLNKEKVTEMADHINGAANRLYRLVENYVIYANLELMRSDETRRTVLNSSRTHYPVIIIEQEIRQLAIDHGREADLEVNTVELPRHLRIDPDNLSRIVHELGDNAFKFSEAGELVRLDILAYDDYFVLKIQDQGMGMQTEDIESIGAYMQFERAFFEQQGLGFGLVIASRMVEVHGGEFDMQSEMGVGTTVTIHLPFAEG